MNDARGWEIYDRPDLRAAIAGRSRVGCEVLVALDGMHCAGCAARAERLLDGEVHDIRINLTARTLGFSFRPETTRLSELLRRLDQAGLQPRVLARQSDERRQVAGRRRAFARIGVASICAVQVMMLAWPGYFGAHPRAAVDQLLRWSQWVVATPCVLWAGWPFFAGAAAAIRSRALNMDVPVALALAGAYGASALHVMQATGALYFDTATMFVWFLSIGRQLEGRTRARAAAHLRLLLGRRALTAQRRRSDHLETVPIESLAVDDLVFVPPGEALPADGTLVPDAAELDESLLTGESRAIVHRTGEPLLAGSVNVGRAPLELRVTHVGDQTRLAQITALLDHAQTEKPKLQQLTDRVAGHFVAGVLAFAAIGVGLALLRGSGGAEAFDIALAVLVASCPCALSLAVPAALAAVTSRLAAAGLLVTRSGAVQRLTRIDTVIFDKTGTLTRPRMRVERAGTLGSMSLDECTAIAAALERGSRHPIAAAFANLPSSRQADALDYSAGAGLRGEIDGHRYWIGAVEAAPAGLALPPAAHTDSRRTNIVLTGEDGPLAWFTLDNELRPETQPLIDELRQRGLALEILSGDAPQAVATLAQRLGIADYRARQTPPQKLARLRALRAQGRRVLAVGDGVNDAPLLAAADVSAALPQGAALTQARADLLLLGDSLAVLPAALDAARRAQRRIVENLVWAVAYNLVVLPLALTGNLEPWLAAAGMSVSSLVVVSNALRVGGGRRKRPPVAAGPTSAARLARAR